MAQKLEDWLNGEVKELSKLPVGDLSNTFFPWMNGDRAGFYGSALAYDLGSLRHIQEYLD